MVAIVEQVGSQPLARICREFHVRRLWVFGSTARGEDRSTSDIDLLVEFEARHTPGFFRFGELADRLTEVLNGNGGRKVDLVTLNALHHLIRPQVLKERILLYEG